MRHAFNCSGVMRNLQRMRGLHEGQALLQTQHRQIRSFELLFDPQAAKQIHHDKALLLHH